MAADIAKALRERPVIEAIGAIMEDKLVAVMAAVRAVELENSKLSKSVSATRDRIDELERHPKSENLIVIGLPSQSFAEAANPFHALTALCMYIILAQCLSLVYSVNRIDLESTL